MRSAKLLHLYFSYLEWFTEAALPYWQRLASAFSDSMKGGCLFATAYFVKLLDLLRHHFAVFIYFS